MTNLWRSPQSLRLRVHLALVAALVVVPMALGLFAMLWIRFCALLFIPGMLLATAGIFMLYFFSLYTLPVHTLLGGVCFNDAFLGDLIPHPLPCSAAAWLAIAAVYGVVACVMAQLVVPLLSRLPRTGVGR
jgi:hypothetical protein